MAGDDFIISRDKWIHIYNSFGGSRRNGEITTAEKIKAKKKHRKKK